MFATRGETGVCTFLCPVSLVVREAKLLFKLARLPIFCNLIAKLFGNLMGCFIMVLLAGVPLHWDSGGEVNRKCASWWFIVRFLGIT
jgi:hypothetical protein